MDVGTLGVRIDVQHSYRQAIEAAYERAKRLGPVDKDLAEECEYIISRPEDPPFDEAELYLSAPGMSTPGISYGIESLTTRQFYEKLRLDKIRQSDPISLAAVKVEFNALKDKLDKLYPELCRKMSGVTLDDQQDVKVFAPPGVLSQEQETKLNTWFNEMGDFRKLMIEHHKNMLDLLDE